MNENVPIAFAVKEAMQAEIVLIASLRSRCHRQIPAHLDQLILPVARVVMDVHSKTSSAVRVLLDLLMDPHCSRGEPGSDQER